MKNFRLQPFEKNNYFYGKLLTVRDFQIEQKYSDEKRWMLNRLMFGSGVATGLKVIMIDEQTISIEAGVSIDNLGREIVVASPITQKLSLIEGFDNSGYAKSVYLCIDYEEKGKERIQTITNSVDEIEDDISSYNRIQESYKLYLRENIAEDDLNKSSSTALSKTCIFENEQVQIFQYTPKYVQPNEEFDINVEIIKKDAACKLEFNYELDSKNASSTLDKKQDFISVEFNEGLAEAKSNYSLKYKMTAASKLDKNAMLSISVKSIKLDEKVVNKLNDIFIEFSIVNNKLDAIVNAHNGKSIDNIADMESFETIYLAKIDMLKVGMTYLIKSITNVPFNQYVYGNSIIIDMLKEKINKLSIEDNNKKAESKVEVIKEEDIIAANGEYVFKFDFNAKYPNLAYSKEIVHGLGEGEVYISTAIMTEENFEDVMISGDIDIFDKNNCKIATTLYPTKGAFVIAVKAENSFPNNQLRVKWQAIKNTPNIYGVF